MSIEAKTRLTFKNLRRRNEIFSLLSAFKDVQQENGGVQVIFLKGLSGTGKSTVIKSAFYDNSNINNSNNNDNGDRIDSEPLTAGKTFLVGTAKFDQDTYNRSAIPFAALRSVLSEICNQILESDTLEKFRKAIKQQVAFDHRQTLMNWAPEMQSLFQQEDIFNVDVKEPILRSSCYSVRYSGRYSARQSARLNSHGDLNSWNMSSSAGDELNTSKNKNTSNDDLNVVKFALRSFFRAIAKILPTVICIEDVMWSDGATLDVLQSIITDKNLQHVLLCATYRSNEVPDDDESHKVNMWKMELEKRTKMCQNITLGNLDVSEVQHLMSDAMQIQTSEVSELAEVIHGRTQGNIFFVLQLLEHLQDDSLIYRENERWVWKLAEIKGQTYISNSVLEVVCSRIKRLPPMVQDLLKIASCLGSRFDVETLEIIKTVTNINASVYACLDEAKKQELVIELGQSNYKFSHDMIQLASNSLLTKGRDENEMRSLHWQIGNALIESDGFDSNSHMMFTCADQLILSGLDFFESDIERERLAALYLAVGKMAVSLSAFLPASRYFKAGIEILRPEEEDASSFNSDYYELSLELFTLHAQTELCSGHIKESKEAARLVIAHAKTDIDKRSAILVFIDCLSAEAQHEELVTFVLELLNQMGEDVPRIPPPHRLKAEYNSMKKRLKDKSDDDILTLPCMDENSKEKIFFKLLFNFAQSCDQLGLESLIGYITMWLVRMMLKYGLTEGSPDALAFLAYYFVVYKHDINQCCHFGKLANQLVEQSDFFAGSKTRTLCILSGCVRVWKDPLPQCLDTAMEGYSTGMQNGDLMYGFMCIVMYGMDYFCSGLPLDPLLKDIENYSLQMLEYKQNFTFYLNVPLWQCLLNLTSESNDPVNMEEGEAMEKLNSVDKKFTMFEIVWLYQMQIAFYVGDIEKSIQLAKKLKEAKSGFIMSGVLGSSRNFFMALIYLASYRSHRKYKDKDKAKMHMKLVGEMVETGAINLVHRLQLLRAEYQSSSFKPKDFEEIYQQYEKAINSATRTGFVQDAALAHYLCSRFCRRTRNDGDFTIEEREKASSKEISHIMKSYDLYMTWGALAVAKSLVRRYQSVFCDSLSSDGSNSMDFNSSFSDMSIKWERSVGGRNDKRRNLRGRSRFNAKASQSHRVLPFEGLQIEGD